MARFFGRGFFTAKYFTPGYWSPEGAGVPQQQEAPASGGRRRRGLWRLEKIPERVALAVEALEQPDGFEALVVSRPAARSLAAVMIAEAPDGCAALVVPRFDPVMLDNDFMLLPAA